VSYKNTYSTDNIQVQHNGYKVYKDTVSRRKHIKESLFYHSILMLNLKCIKKKSSVFITSIKALF